MPFERQQLISRGVGSLGPAIHAKCASTCGVCGVLSECTAAEWDTAVPEVARRSRLCGYGRVAGVARRPLEGRTHHSCRRALAVLLGWHFTSPRGKPFQLPTTQDYKAKINGGRSVGERPKQGDRCPE